MSTFEQNRLALRAVLISALLILGHILLTTTASASIRSYDQLVPAIKSTSSLIFLTLLWTTFTLLEAVDAHLVPALGFWMEADDTEGLVFGRTWVEFTLNSALMAAWAIWSADAVLAMASLSPLAFPEFMLIPVTFGISILAVTALQAQITRSILGHVFVVGTRKSIFSSTFWNRRTGHWTEHITLGEMAKEYSVNVSIKEVEEEEEVWERLGEKMGRVVTQLRSKAYLGGSRKDDILEKM